MGIYEVSVEHFFRAVHAVRLADGAMERPHRHDWRVTAVFRRSRLDEAMGVVVDFLEVQEALKAITADLEGADLNLLPDFDDRGASAERLAELLARRLVGRLEAGGKLYRLGVCEAPGCSAAYYPGGDP